MRNPTIDSAFSASSGVAVVLASTAFSLGLLVPASAAAQVYRCEAAGGQVTYTNERCPTGARRTRVVDDSPPVQAPSDRPVTSTAARPAEAVAKSGDESAPARATAAGATVSRMPAAANLTPAQQFEQLDRERDRQRSVCEQLQRRIAFARNDFDAATGGQRASYELQLRRLQEDHLAQCQMQR
jgi:hypothetical protein